MEEGSLGL